MLLTIFTSCFENPLGNDLIAEIDVLPGLTLTLVSVAPASIANDNNPVFTGSTLANATVDVYSDSVCTSLLTTTTANAGGTFTFTQAVVDDSVNSYYLLATETSGNKSNCSDPFTFTEDSTPPVDPTVLTSSPLLKGENLSPNISGLAEVLSTVDIYDDAGCTNQIGTGTATALGTFLVTATVTADQVSTLYTDSTDVAGNTSGCSATFVNYEGYTIADNMAIFTSTQLISGADINTAAADAMEFDGYWDETYFNFSTAVPEDIEVLVAGDYFITVNLPMESAVQRANVRIEVHLDDVKVLGAEGQQGYIRNQNGHNRASSHFSGFVEGVANGQVLEIKLIEEGTSGVVNVETGEVASVFIENIDTTNDILFVSGSSLVSGADFNPAAKSLITWTNNPVKDAAFYTHNTGVAPEDITLAAGDYLLIYNDTINSAIQRPNNRITVELDGTEVNGAICSSHYIRNGSAHTESSCSLVYFLRNVKAGQVLNISSQQEALGGAVNFNDDALLMLWKKD